MNPEQIEQVMKQAEELLAKVTALDCERKELEKQIIELFPIKIDEKVSIMDNKDSHVRYAFIQRINIDDANEIRGARISFKLNRCTVGGKRSYQNDYLSKVSNEYITKIK